MCTIELLALWGIFISASAENVLIICVNINFYHYWDLVESTTTTRVTPYGVIIN